MANKQNPEKDLKSEWGNVVQLIKGLASNCWKMQKSSIACLQGFIQHWTLELISVVREKWKRKSFLFSSCANKSERRLKWVHEKESKQMHQICVNGIKNWYSVVGRWKRRSGAWKLKKISFEEFFFSCLHALHEQCKCTLKSPAPGDIRENPFAARVASFLLASRDTS